MTVRHGHAIFGDDLVLDPTIKGIPAGVTPFPLHRIAEQGWNVLRGDCPLPLAVLRTDILEMNRRWMRAFLDLNGLALAPHGKTTMAPALFADQMADGAWAMTVATAHQLAVAAKAGIGRIVLANQPIGQTADACFSTLQTHPSLELHCLADSLEGVAILAEAAKRHPSMRPLHVMVELGSSGARTGCRTVDSALAVAHAVSATPGLALSGIEAFEGVLADRLSIDELLGRVVEVARRSDAAGLFANTNPIVVSAGGTSYFDYVSLAFRDLNLSRPLIKLLRSGCYLTHDTFGYAKDHERILAERQVQLPPGRLQPALEIWTSVQSVPDPDKALLTAGKRDVSYDAGLPLPVGWLRPGVHTSPQDLSSDHMLTALNDQHAHLHLPAGSPLQVGDMVALGIAHPCTTFDKWQVMPKVDADYRIVGAIRTFF